MFHAKDNLFFGRMKSGDVRIIKFYEIKPGCWPKADDAISEMPGNMQLDYVLSADLWASIVSSVSANGESLETWQTARKFHSTKALEDCPHAAPFRYCETCKVSPCPIGLDEKARQA